MDALVALIVCFSIIIMLLWSTLSHAYRRKDCDLKARVLEAVGSNDRYCWYCHTPVGLSNLFSWNEDGDLVCSACAPEEKEQ